MLKIIFFITLSTLFGYACTGQQPDSASTDSVQAERPPVQAVVPRKSTEAPMPKSSSEVPENLLRLMTEHVVRESGLNAGQVTTLHARKATWPNGSLGCPEAGLMYTQALVEGFWVVMLAGGEEYDFRAGRSDKFMRCQSKTKQAPIKYDDT